MSRNAITAALETRIKAALETAGLVTWSSIPKPHTDFAPEKQPAAFLVMGDEANVPEPRSKWRIDADLYVFARNGATDTAQHTLNDLVDAVETSCKRVPGEQAPGTWSTLGGTVYAVRPTGVESYCDDTGEQEMRIVRLEIIAAG